MFSLGLFNHKSSSTNRVEVKSKPGNRRTCYAEIEATILARAVDKTWNMEHPAIPEHPGTLNNYDNYENQRRPMAKLVD